MSLNLEVEVDVPFTFDYEALAGEVVAFTIDHEGFPYEAEVNLTLTIKRVVPYDNLYALSRENAARTAH